MPELRDELQSGAEGPGVPLIARIAVQLGDLAAADFAAAGSPEGRAWIAAVPSLLADLARQWDLAIVDAEFRHGYNAIVLPVGRGNRALALKLTWPPEQAGDEAEALAAWRGEESSN